MIGNQTLGSTTFGEQNIVDPKVPAVASASSISPVGNVTRITGNTTISTIVQPTPYFNGPLWLLNTDASVGTWDTAGNIALAGTMTRYKLFAFVYDPTTSKWYPSAAS